MVASPAASTWHELAAAFEIVERWWRDGAKSSPTRSQDADGLEYAALAMHAAEYLQPQNLTVKV